ncbi:hypothetical protein BTR23_11725 [Alkalihalophilus pseudofirmus]|uniref:DUF4352 domain-containing protein n=1 Tax=Alkalihalobacterium alkalinitrilicum TaxID=427920 RepID=UPI00094D18EB|nr:DUF4352 domain-containing protein [Alkalihalobacterium alkalinitrilicum]OLO38061.1 hypothetical protein BTR23_11725 [Alkalihalophilus pseudofirmus]
MKVMAKILLIFLLFISLNACGEAEVSPVEQEKEQEQEEQENAAEELQEELDEAEEEPEGEGETEENLSIGDSVNFNDIVITLNDVAYSQGSDWETPNEATFLLADFTVENTSDESYNISSMMNFAIYDEEHFKHSITIYTDAKGSMDGEIGPGRTMRGEVAFDVPESSYYEVVFEEPFTNGQAIWVVEP